MTENSISSQLAVLPEGRRRWGSGTALLAGFGALLVLMAIVCIDALHSLSAFETNDTQIRNDLVTRRNMSCCCVTHPTDWKQYPESETAPSRCAARACLLSRHGA